MHFAQYDNNVKFKNFAILTVVLFAILIYNTYVKGKAMENIVIGIEGLVGAGKTSICRELLNCMPNTVLLNGGNLYRAITHVLLTSGKNVSDLSKMNNVDIKLIMDILGIEIKIENKETAFYVKGTKIEEKDMQSESASIRSFYIRRNCR